MNHFLTVLKSIELANLTNFVIDTVSEYSHQESTSRDTLHTLRLTTLLNATLKRTDCTMESTEACKMVLSVSHLAQSGLNLKIPIILMMLLLLIDTYKFV